MVTNQISSWFWTTKLGKLGFDDLKCNMWCHGGKFSSTFHWKTFQSKSIHESYEHAKS
jgi:hypothetical protein